METKPTSFCAFSNSVESAEMRGMESAEMRGVESAEMRGMGMRGLCPAQFSRLSLLTGDEGFARLQKAHLFVCGTGGVGSWAVEMLVRSGIGKLTMMDPDIVKPSNINRQLCALNSTLGRPKVAVLAERMRDISPDSTITALPHHLDPSECEAFLLEHRFDCVIDAIDERPAKLALLENCHRLSIPVISSMGAANKLDASLVRAADISESFGCPLARLIRKSLHKVGIEHGIRVVFSPEPPLRETSGNTPEAAGEKRPIGSIAYLPALFGLTCAAEAIRIILQKNPVA